jgi:phosphatidate cytidylyltransferase
MDSANAASAVSPRNKSSLTRRILSAVALLPLVVGLVWWSAWAVVAVVFALTVLGLLELYGAFAHAGYQPRVGVGLGVALALVLAVTLQQIGPFDLLPLVLTLAVLVSLVAALPYNRDHGALPAWGLTLAGALYIGWLFSHMIMLRALVTPLRVSPLGPLGLSSGAAWLYLVLAITWLQDTLAYFVGRSWGHHKMAPTLSPKKTWEGAIGGLIGSILGGVVCVPLLGLPISLGAGMLLGLVGGVVGPLGDLAESMIKRQVGLKDAGHLIPGHGGILDRVDSILFTGPVLFYLIKLLGDR